MANPSDEFVKIDASFLPTGYTAQGVEGLVAQFYADGQLERLCVLEAGKLVSSELLLEQGIAEARMYDYPGDGSSRNWYVYRDGTVESFDAWSDNSRPSVRAWVPWVTTQIECICKEWQTWEKKDSPIFKAIRSGNEAIVAELLDSNSRYCESPNSHGRTPLIEAARSGKLAIVQRLLDRGAEINAQQRAWHMDLQKWVNGETALSAACAAGHIDVVRLLVERKANLELTDIDGSTPLVRAAAAGHLEVIRLLVELGDPLVFKNPEQGYSALHVAVRHHACIELLLDAGIAVDTPDRNGWTSILFAINANAPISVIRLLIARGANLQTSRAGGYTALHFAVASGRPDIVQLLLDHGADLAACTQLGKTPLDEAIGWQKSTHTSIPQADRDQIVMLLKQVANG
jgi:ankyrin repeat protein